MLFLVVLVLTAAVPVVIARFRVTRLLCVLVMVATALFAVWAATTSDDAQAGLAFLWVPIVAIPLSGFVVVAEGVIVTRRTPPGPRRPATLRERLAGFLIDLVLAFGLLVVPIKMLSDRDHEIHHS